MEIIQTDTYMRWFASLRDIQAKARIDAAIRKISIYGSLVGDVKPVGGSISELRFHFGPGYRVYVSVEGQTLLILLAGGDKSTQRKDIETAQRLSKEWKEGSER